MPQLKNRHEEKCLFPSLPLQTYVPKRVCAFTRARAYALCAAHKHDVFAPHISICAMLFNM